MKRLTKEELAKRKEQFLKSQTELRNNKEMVGYKIDHSFEKCMFFWKEYVLRLTYVPVDRNWNNQVKLQVLDKKFKPVTKYNILVRTFEYVEEKLLSGELVPVNRELREEVNEVRNWLREADTLWLRDEEQKTVQSGNFSTVSNEELLDKFWKLHDEYQDEEEDEYNMVRNECELRGFANLPNGKRGMGTWTAEQLEEIEQMRQEEREAKLQKEQLELREKAIARYTAFEKALAKEWGSKFIPFHNLSKECQEAQLLHYSSHFFRL